MSEEAKDPNLDQPQDLDQVSEPEQADSSLSEDVVVSNEGQPEGGELLESEGEAVAAVESPHKGFLGKMDNYFGISRSGSTYRAEIIAGVTTFMAMCYILIVNAGMFSESWMIQSDNAFGAAYIATCIGAIVGTLLMAFVAKMPLAQASGMGVNAFICYTLCYETGLTYANALVFVLLDGVIFLLLTVTGLRTKIFEAIPSAVRSAITVGIGLFIAYIGLQGAGFIVLDLSADVEGAIGSIDAGMLGSVEEALEAASEAAAGEVQSAVGGSTISGMVSFNILGSTFAFTDIIGPIVLLAGVIAIAIMSKKNVKGAVLWGLLGSTALYYILHGISYAAGSEVSAAMFAGISMTNPFSAFAAWGKDSVATVFYEGFDFSLYLESDTVGSLVLLLITSAISLCMIDMFDTIGTLYGACERGGLLDKDGKPIRMERMMLADSIATCTGAVAGTSTVTTFVESSAGVAAGGKTGFTALIVALLFVVAMFLSPIAQLIPSAATATALVWVGVLMMGSVTKINWKDPVDALVAFLTFIVMLLGYSISKGIGIGIIAYILIKLCSGKVKEIHVATWVIGALYLVAFLISPI